jgi:G3E family GTPase
MEAIIVIVGFLGSGKTTLLKKLVNEYLNHDWQPYIILNDYENARVDSQQFLEQLPKNQVNALSGACICCSGINELRQTVNDIPQRKKGITLIEANGTSDAATLMGFMGVGLRDNFLPPVQISVVDARNWQNRGHQNELEANQIQVSSLIVLNYADQVDEERLEKIKADIKYLNPSTHIKAWGDLDAFELPELTPSKNEANAIEHLKSHWSSCSVDLPDPMKSEHLHAVLDKIPLSILRIKGCTRLDDHEYYSFVERIASGQVFIRPYSGTLITGPKLLTIGPGSNPDEISNLIKQETL